MGHKPVDKPTISSRQSMGLKPTPNMHTKPSGRLSMVVKSTSNTKPHSARTIATPQVIVDDRPATSRPTMAHKIHSAGPLSSRHHMTTKATRHSKGMSLQAHIRGKDALQHTMTHHGWVCDGCEDIIHGLIYPGSSTTAFLDIPSKKAKHPTSSLCKVATAVATFFWVMGCRQDWTEATQWPSYNLLATAWTYHEA